jgi:alpha-tubulin suppressor-like RCC1 family protein
MCKSCQQVLLTEAGVIYSFGEGDYGPLGHNSTDTELEPRIVEALRSVKVCAIVAGAHMSHAVAAGGAAYGWGYGEDATLGLGLTQDQLTPLQYPGLQLRV